MVSNQFKAYVKEVLSGDTVIIAPSSENFSLEKTFSFSYIHVEHMARGDQDQESDYAFQAREFVRKKCIGQEVLVEVHYRVPTLDNRDFGALLVGPEQENICLSLVQAGLAKVREKRGRDTQPEAELRYAESDAQANRLGIWSGKEHFNKIDRVNSETQAKKVFKTLKDKPQNIIIEHVRDAGTFRVRVGKGKLLKANLTAVRVPRVRKQDDDGKTKSDIEAIEAKIAEPAKHFAQLKLLNREFLAHFEGTHNGNFSISVVTNSSKKKQRIFQEELLTKGYAMVMDWEIPRTKFASALRKAEQIGKDKKIGYYSVIKPIESTTDQLDKTRFEARLFDLITADLLVVIDNDNTTHKISLSSVIAPRIHFGKIDKKRKDSQFPSKLSGEAFAFEAKEFVRSRLADKKLKVEIEYVRNITDSEGKVLESRPHCSVAVQGKNIALDLVNKGYARVVRHGMDQERSKYYDALLSGEDVAKRKKRGIHSNKTKKDEIVDFSNQTKKEAEGRIGSYQHQKKVRGVVDKVLAANRVRFYDPTTPCFFVFAISGIGCPARKGQEADPFADEAFFLSQKLLQQREVQIEVHAVDPTGAFLGNLFAGDNNHAAELLRNGFAYTMPAVRRNAHRNALMDAESYAKENNLGIWSTNVKPKRLRQLEERAEEKPQKSNAFGGYRKAENEVIEVAVTEVVQTDRVFLQTADSQETLGMIENAILEMNPEQSVSDATTLSDNVLCVAYSEVCQGWLRGKALSQDPDNNTAEIQFIDFGHIEDVPLDKITTALPEVLRKTKPQAKEFHLAFLKHVPESHEAFEACLEGLRELCFGHRLTADVKFRIDGVPYANLYDIQNKCHINDHMIRNGLCPASTNDPQATRDYKDEYDNLKKVEAAAKRQASVIWIHGDYEEVDF